MKKLKLGKDDKNLKDKIPSLNLDKIKDQNENNKKDDNKLDKDILVIKKEKELEEKIKKLEEENKIFIEKLKF